MLYFLPGEDRGSNKGRWNFEERKEEWLFSLFFCWDILNTFPRSIPIPCTTTSSGGRGVVSQNGEERPNLS